MTQPVQTKLLDSIAHSLDIESGLLRVTSISDARRRRLAVSIEVEATVANNRTAHAMAARTSEVATAAADGASSAGFNVTVQATSSVKLPSLESPPSSPIPISSPPSTPSPAQVAVDIPIDTSSADDFFKWIGIVGGTAGILSDSWSHA